MILVVDACAEPFERRGLDWDLTSLPVPADVLVYTRTELESMLSEGTRFATVVANETEWLYDREEE